MQKKIKLIKEFGLWNELREEYLNQKNINNDENKKSRSIFAESVNEVYKKYQNK